MEVEFVAAMRADPLEDEDADGGAVVADDIVAAEYAPEKVAEFLSVEAIHSQSDEQLHLNLKRNNSSSFPPDRYHHHHRPQLSCPLPDDLLQMMHVQREMNSHASVGPVGHQQMAKKLMALFSVLVCTHS